MVDSVVNGLQLVGSGSVSIAVGVLEALSTAQKADGAPIEWVWIPPSAGAEQMTAVSTAAPHADAALCFMNFLLTDKGQTALNGQRSVSLLNDELPGAAPVPEGYYSVTSEQARAAREAVYDIYGVSE